MVGRRWKWLLWQFTDKLDANFMVGRRWKWLSWQFTDKLDANLWSVDGEIDCRDSLLTNSMQTSWSVDGEIDCRDSLLTHSMQNIGE